MEQMMQIIFLGTERIFLLLKWNIKPKVKKWWVLPDENSVPMLQREGIAVGRTQKSRASEVDGSQKLREINCETKLGGFPILLPPIIFTIFYF